MKSSFTFRDLEKLKFPVLKFFEGRYDLAEMLEFDESAVSTYMVCRDEDPAGTQAIKKWIKLDRAKHPTAKEVTWENLLWLLSECKEDAEDPEAHYEMIKNLKMYITSALGDDSETKDMDTDHNSESTVIIIIIPIGFSIAACAVL